MNGFTQSHFIGQYAVPIFIPVLDHPIQTFQLELFEHSVVLENWDVLSAILTGLFSQTIKQIQFLLHFGDVWIFNDSVIRLLIKLKKELMNLIVNLDPFSGLSVRNLVPVFELEDLIHVVNDRLSLPC